MNWQEIKDKYPKAWEAFEGSVGRIYFSAFGKPYSVLMEGSPEDYLNPRLYYFFDSKGMYISVHLDTIKKECKWCWVLRDGATYGDVTAAYFFGSRTEAESAAFTKAFEVLNTQLS